MSGENTGMPAVLWNVSQNLSDSEKGQARTNIGVDRSVTLVDGPSTTLENLWSILNSGKYPVICFSLSGGNYLMPFVVTDGYISCIYSNTSGDASFEYAWISGGKGARPHGKQRVNFEVTIPIDDTGVKVATIYRDGVRANGDFSHLVLFSLYIRNASATSMQARLVNDATDADAPTGYYYTYWSNKEYTKTAQPPVNAYSTTGTFGNDWDAGGSITGGSWNTLGSGETSALTSTVLVKSLSDAKKGMFKIFIVRVTDTNKFFGYIEEQ